MSQKKLSPRQIQILLSFVKGSRYSISSITTFQSLTETSRSTIKRDLSFLEKMGYISHTGTLRSTEYYLTQKGIFEKPIQAEEYLIQTESQKNGAKFYNFDLFLDLTSYEIFLGEELEIFSIATRNFKERSDTVSPTLQKKELERFIIELSWKSSRIEGNTYTLLDTERLLREGIPASGHTKDETKMILNHKDAFDFLYTKVKNMHNTILSTKDILEIHSILTKDLKIQSGVRNGPVGITGSSYIPLSLSYTLTEELEKLVNTINSQKNPYAKSMIAILGISYLQPFEDGNKRTTRLLANYLLLLGSSAPLSYRTVDETLYRESLLVFYEQYSFYSFKKIFIEQYLFACEYYNI